MTWNLKTTQDGTYLEKGRFRLGPFRDRESAFQHGLKLDREDRDARIKILADTIVLGCFLAGITLGVIWLLFS